MKTFMRKQIATYTLALAALASTSAHAIVSIGLKGGANMSSIAIDPAIPGYTAYGTGYMAGLGFKLGAGVVGFLVDAMYAQRTVKTNAYMGTPATTYKMNNLYLPAQINFGFGPLLITAGGFYQMMLGDVNVNGVSYAPSTQSMDTSDYGVVAGVGIKVSKFSVEARYNFGLKDTNTSPATTTTSRSIDLLAGYWF